MCCEQRGCLLCFPCSLPASSTPPGPGTNDQPEPHRALPTLQNRTFSTSGNWQVGPINTGVEPLHPTSSLRQGRHMGAQACTAPHISLEGQQESLCLGSCCHFGTFNTQPMSKNNTLVLVQAAAGRSSGGLLSSPVSCADGLPCPSPSPSLPLLPDASSPSLAPCPQGCMQNSRREKAEGFPLRKTQN